MSDHSHPLWELTRARMIEMIREPAVIFWVFGFPLLLAIGLGIAFRNKGPEKSHVALVGERPGALEILSASPDVVVEKLSLEEARAALRKSKVVLIAQVDTSSAVTYYFDPNQPESRPARLAVEEALQRAAGRSDVLTAEEKPSIEKGGRYIDFLLPGLLGLNLMGSSMWGIGYAVVDARSRKLLKRLAATPLNRSYFLGSFVIWRFVTLVFEVAVLVIFGLLAFDVELRGGVLALSLVSLLGAASFAGLALMIAARVKRTEVASGWMNFVMMPMWLLSGSFFSYERFPEFLHPILRALPLTALNDALRGVMNEGAALSSMGVELLVLSLWGVVGFFIAAKIFRWQ